MKKLFLITILLMLVSVTVALAQNKNQAGSQNSVQNKNVVQTQNQGEEQNLQVSTQEQESFEHQESSEATQASSKGYETKSQSPRSEKAQEQMSNVAKKVEELLTTQGAKGGIGQQISQFAQEQKQSQNQIEDLLVKIDSKPGILKRIFGTDYSSVNNLKKQVEQNEQRINLLQQLQAQVQNRAEETQLKETIQSLISLNNSLENKIQAEEKVTSIFGWFIKLFVK